MTHFELIEMCYVVDGVPHNFAKNGVLLVQVRAGFLCDEKLTAVCVRLILICTGYNAPADHSTATKRLVTIEMKL